MVGISPSKGKAAPTRLGQRGAGRLIVVLNPAGKFRGKIVRPDREVRGRQVRPIRCREGTDAYRAGIVTSQIESAIAG